MGRQSFEPAGAGRDVRLLYAVAAVTAVLILVLVRVLIWWLGLIVRGSLPATILFGLYNVFNGVVLLIPAVVEASWLLLGVAALLIVLGSLFLLPSSLTWTRGSQ